MYLSYNRYVSSSAETQLSTALAATAAAPQLNYTSSGGTVAPQLNLNPRRRCTASGHVAGSWVFESRRDSSQMNNDMPVHPPCCSWDSVTTFAAGEGDCLGREEALTSDWSALAPTRFMPAGGFSCSCAAPRHANFSAFSWVPSQCALPEWNPRAFCKALGRKRILFIGDSTGQQLAAGIRNYLVAGGVHYSCVTQILFNHSDTLVGESFGHLNRGDPWNASVARLQPDIVILGAAFHIFTNANYSRVLESVRDTFTGQFADTPLRLVWRTQMGATCGVAPVSTLPGNVPGFWDEPARAVYNHALIEGFDESARVFWRGVPHASVLDLQPMWLRPDTKVGAPDCIHVCMPEPILIAARILQNLLLDT